MNIDYKRSMGQSYMVIEPDVLYRGYEEHILKNNDLKCLLTFYSTNSNGLSQLWYDISKKRALRDLIEQEGLTRELLTKLMTQLELAYAEVKSYLIADSHLYLTPDTIFVDTRESGFSIYLCYVPTEDGMQEIGLEMLFEYFIQMVDHEDEELRELCYELYDGVMSQKESIISIAERLKTQCASKETNATNFPEYSANEGYFGESGGREDVPAIPEEEDGLPEMGEQNWTEETDNKEKEKLGRKIAIRLKERVVQKWKRLFPPREPKMTLDGFEEEPEEIYEPTRLLTENYCQGILKYQGEGAGNDFLIRKSHFTVGNLKGNDAYIHNETVSKHHARILKGAGGEYLLEDLNSTNGTFVNGKMLPYKQQYKLEAGDEVCFANVKYQFL